MEPARLDPSVDQCAPILRGSRKLPPDRSGNISLCEAFIELSRQTNPA